MPTTQPCLSCLRVGDRVTNLPLRAHLTASRLTKETDDTQRQNTPATRPKKKGRWQSKPPAAKAQPAASAHTNPLTQFASAELTNGRTRCLFTDDTATIAGEIDEKWIDSIQSADRVTVDGRVELQEGRVVLVGQNSEAIATSVHIIYNHRSLAHPSHVFLFPLVAFQ